MATHTCPPGHPHTASTNCYNRHRCRCKPCITNHRAYQNKYRKWGRDGLPTNLMIDATATRDRIQAALNQGATVRGISLQTRVAYSTVYRIARGETKKVEPDTADRIEQLTAAPTGNIPAYRIARRLQALRAIGYPMDHIATHVDCSPEALSLICLERRDTVNGYLANRIIRFYQAHELKRGPSKLAATKAAQHGYLPPAAWDNIDDPDETPDQAHLRRTRAAKVKSIHSAAADYCPRCGVVFHKPKPDSVCRDCANTTTERAAA